MKKLNAVLTVVNIVLELACLVLGIYSICQLSETEKEE